MGDEKRAAGVIARYILALIIGLGNLYVIYLIFTPLTIYASYYILGNIYSIATADSIFLINDTIIEISSACVAGAAYYLLIALNLLTPMNIKKRTLLFIISIPLLFIANILRIVVLSAMAVNGTAFFDITHKIIWYGLSTIFVVGIWFFCVWILKIKGIPVYTDFVNLKKMLVKPSAKNVSAKHGRKTKKK